MWFLFCSWYFLVRGEDEDEDENVDVDVDLREGTDERKKEELRMVTWSLVFVFMVSTKRYGYALFWLTVSIPCWHKRS